MNDFKLSDDQENAINKFKEFLKSKDIDFCLSGKAGSGNIFCRSFKELNELLQTNIGEN